MIIDEKIVIIGTGNLGLNLMNTFLKHEINVLQGFTRKKINAARIQQKTGVDIITDLKEVNPNGTVYIFSLPDDKIQSKAKSLIGIINPKALLIHCSGASPDNLLNLSAHPYGVLYPLQSFSAEKSIDFSDVPVFYNASTSRASKQIKLICEMLSERSIEANEQHRNALHLSAVISCNFTNYLLVKAAEICREYGVDFQNLRPLIQETVQKAFELGPENTQTGPAIRQDYKTIKNHLDLLEENSAEKTVYLLMTDQILNHFSK